MKLNEIYFNLLDSTIRVKIIRIEKAFIMVKVISGYGKGYQKRFKKGIEQEAFLTYFVPVPPLFFELE